MAWDATAEIDFILADDVIAGDQLVISRSGMRIATATGVLNRKQIIVQGNAGIEIIGRDLTFLLREGTQGTARVEDSVTVTTNLGTFMARIRDLGEPQSDGTRLLTLASS